VMTAPVISISFDTSEESVPVVPTDPIVTPEVGTVSVVSPARVLDLVDYSSSFDSDPSEDFYLPHQICHWFHPFCVLMTRRRTSFPLHLLLPYPGFVDVQRLLSDPVRLSLSVDLIAPTPMSRCTFRSFLIRTYTTDADSSTPQRFVHRSLTRTPRHSEAFRRWRSAPLSTPYPPTTSESSLGSSSERLIAPTPADLLPPHKRFRDSYSSDNSREEHMEVDTADTEAVADVGISDGVV
ncbi:hypothetical protein Tco_0043992, partial [Tanacetum coccineum]